ncbi:MAG: bifunctional phosphopantothenoylcysteine decarboxylase/phosphopantothenate--cysteine ligase CoaBC, partial [Thaumarchaeota archaeon]|nr:bifunctional phosphopantothenoylcysteine decarboxylase/phosphopantothenate--cysteine ligase CoaBC [Nitrososphaerota archaeon]
MRKHPSFDIVSSDGTELAGKKIVLCISGSVAAYKSIELARLFMRHGADVTCVASKAATALIKPSYFKWATGNEVITRLTGDLEHIKVADYKQSDLIVVYPCTANTLGKLANGIDDTPISTVLSVGFGSKIPIVIALAMHESMYENAAVRKNIDFLEGKVEFIGPNMIEGKAKASEPEEVLDHVLRKFGSSSKLSGKKVLITAGPTIEYIDPVRIITNQSTGKTGVLLASELVSAGAKVTFIYGPGRELPPKGVKLIRVETSQEMFD